MENCYKNSLLTIPGGDITIEGDLEICNSYEEYLNFLLNQRLDTGKEIKLSDIQNRKHKIYK